VERELYLLLSAVAVISVAYLLFLTVDNPYSEAWLDTSNFKEHYSVGEQVSFRLRVRNSLGMDNTYSVRVHVENLEIEPLTLDINNGEVGESEISFTTPNTSFPLKIVVEVQEVDNLSLWVFD
jgi:hypothetical protein